jgi:hypothetical protein
MIDNDSIQRWAETIKAEWHGSTACVMRACAKAAEARARGCLNEVSDALVGVIDASTLRLLAIIGENTRLMLTDPSKLPLHWGTLYELTKLEDAVLRDRLLNGSIYPTMPRRLVNTWSRSNSFMLAPVRAAIDVTSLPFDELIHALDKLRTKAKPSDYALRLVPPLSSMLVKPAQLAMVISFFQAVHTSMTTP